MNQNPRHLTTKELQAELDWLSTHNVIQAEDPGPSGLKREVQVYQLKLELRDRELRSSQLQLEVARDRYQRLYAHAPVGYLTLNRSGCILQANLQAARTLGEECSEVIGSGFSRWIQASRLQSFFEHLEQVFSERKITGTELTLRCSDGRRCEIQLISEIVCARSRGAEYCRSAFVDITPYKEAQYLLDQELAETRQKLQQEMELRQQLQEQLTACERKYRLLLNGATNV